MEITLKLNRAISVVGRLQNELTNTSAKAAKTFQTDIEISLASVELVEKAFEKASKTREEGNSLLHESLLLNNLVYKIRAAISRENATNGINLNLTELERLNSMIAIYSRVSNRKTESLEEQKESYILRAKNLRENDSNRETIYGVGERQDAEMFEEKIRLLNKQRNELKDKNAEINATSQITLVLTDDEAKLLEKYS